MQKEKLKLLQAKMDRLVAKLSEAVASFAKDEGDIEYDVLRGALVNYIAKAIVILNKIENEDVEETKYEVKQYLDGAVKYHLENFKWPLGN